MYTNGQKYQKDALSKLENEIINEGKYTITLKPKTNQVEKDLKIYSKSEK